LLFSNQESSVRSKVLVSRVASLGFAIKLGYNSQADFPFLSRGKLVVPEATIELIVTD